MTDQSSTLRAIFNLSEAAATQGIVAAVDESVWESVLIPRRLRARAAAKIAKTLDAFLSTSISGVVGGALEDHRGLARYADDMHHEVEKFVVSIESEHEPSVDLRMTGSASQTVRFPLIVSFDFSAARLTISNNRVMAMKPGPCVVAGTLMCEEVEIFNRPAAPFKLRHEMLFGDGIPIHGTVRRV
ncbi:MAG: hypothetical protein ABI664_12340 [bacterium]